MMSYQPVKTDDGIEIRDGAEIIATVTSCPPRDEDGLEQLFDDANISTPQKDLFKILFGVAEIEDERTDTDEP